MVTNDPQPFFPDGEPFHIAGVHSAELILKGKNRPFFEKILMKNLRLAISRLGGISEVQQTMGKFLLPLAPGTALDDYRHMLSRIPGVETFFFAHRLPHDLAQLKTFLRRLAAGMDKVPFAIRTRRSYKPFPMNSVEINRELGAVLVAEGWPVDLNRPQRAFHVDVLKDSLLLYSDLFRGCGGLPVGSSGKVVSLLSGGIDSPVAARLLYNRGCRVTYVHYHNQTMDACGVRNKIHRIVAFLQAYQPPSRLYMVPFQHLQKAIVSFCPARERMILYRRVMFRIAQRVADKEDALGFVTGDSIGQVASQTLENLRTIYSVARLPVFTPLIGMNKQQVVDLARHYGTYDISILPYSDCCTFMLARRPETHGRVERMREVEENIDLETLEQEAFHDAEIITF
ncbi:MAG: tRNA 4-thiouridine(8) synthase ThiI [Acidobacteria bacterium]|nr:tRNA 4-thiouridine(8) synthase ThiI [Acidobacteriota bacterium]